MEENYDSLDLSKYHGDMDLVDEKEQPPRGISLLEDIAWM